MIKPEQVRRTEECDVKEEMWTQVTAFKATSGTSASALGHMADLCKGGVSSDLDSLKRKQHPNICE